MTEINWLSLIGKRILLSYNEFSNDYIGEATISSTANNESSPLYIKIIWHEPPNGDRPVWYKLSCGNGLDLMSKQFFKIIE